LRDLSLFSEGTTRTISRKTKKKERGDAVLWLKQRKGGGPVSQDAHLLQRQGGEKTKLDLNVERDAQKVRRGKGKTAEKAKRRRSHIR